MKPKAQVHFPNLDGIRFVAFFMVFISHGFGFNQYYSLFSQNKIFAYFRDHFLYIAGMGVELFFVLSGFLITYLLINEKNEMGSVNIKYFYIRRILRIWPMYFLVIFLGFFIIPEVKGVPLSIQFSFETFKYFPVFLANFIQIKGIYTTPVLGVLWSVSIEEQFYLVWPWLVKFISNKALPFVLLSIILFSLAFKYEYGDSYEMFHYHTFSATSYLATGSLSAFLAYYSEIFTGFIRKLTRKDIIICYFAGVVLFFAYGFSSSFGSFQRIFQVLESFLLGLFYAFVILEQNYSTASLFKMGDFIRITHLGKYTYALYSLHLYPIFITVYIFQLLGLHNNGSANVLVFITEFVLSFLVAIFICMLSYRYYEKYFLDLKSKFTPLT